MLAPLLAGIVFIVLLLILLPLLRARSAEPEAGRFDQAVYRDQLRELDRDLARGVLNDSEASAARLEIQRRLLAAAATPVRPVRGGASPIAAIAVALLVVGGAVGLYLRIGAPGVPDMPFASRTVETGTTKLAQALSALKRRAEAAPSDPEAWANYGRAAADLNQWKVAADALKRAIDLGQADPELLSAYGEMLTLTARGTVVPAARAAFAAALAKDPSLEAARYYMALAAGQDGDPAGELSRLQALLADLPADSPGRADIVSRIADAAKAAGVPVPPPPPAKPAAPGPDAATAAAASQLPPEQREAMIRGMVARLAEKMAANPGDFDGWMRLGRAYGVLGDAAKAMDAYRNAAALKPGDADSLQRVAQAMLADRPATAQVPPAAVQVLQDIETAAPGQPAVLWYLGLAAAQNGKPDDALAYWGRLLARLPPDGEEAKTIKSAMDALRHQ